MACVVNAKLIEIIQEPRQRCSPPSKITDTGCTTAEFVAVDKPVTIPYPLCMDLENITPRRNVLTVSELTKSVKYLLESNYADIWVSGEVSNYTRASSGHIYFTLKDERAVVRTVLFKGYQKGVRFDIENGLKLIVHGSLSVFEKRGEYQIIADFLEPEGLGALQLAFEQLKEKLQKEGLFDELKKRPLPAFPDTIGVVSSETGAAIRDILNVIRRRHSGVRIIIYPTLVQGDEAAQSIARAIQRANERNEVDVLIVSRGGGSIEDLWPFNEEAVARAVFHSSIPIISGVGHEIDFTITDFVADVRAPTPSAAAELVVKNKIELLKTYSDLRRRLFESMSRTMQNVREPLSRFTVQTLGEKLTRLLREKQLVLDDVSGSLSASMETYLTRMRGRFEKLVGQLDVLSPLATLSRGYSITSKIRDGKTLVSIADVAAGDEIGTLLGDGRVLSRVVGTGKTDTDTIP
jgi:exodeoxyribonuclease VII large subunit